MEVTVQSTGIYGRVIGSVRGTQIVVDATKTRGGPGEAPTSVEVFLAGLLACGTVICETQAKDLGIPLRKATFHAKSEYTKAIFANIDITVSMEGVTRAEAERLVEVYATECPIYRLAKLSAPTTLTIVSPTAER